MCVDEEKILRKTLEVTRNYKYMAKRTFVMTENKPGNISLPEP